MTSGCRREKAVLVAVYAERHPLSRDKQGGRHLHHHHGHHHYHHFHENVSRNAGRVRGYNRRAELLDYARHLRASAQSAVTSASHPCSHAKQLPTEIFTSDRKRKHSNSPTCPGKWECLIPSFLRSVKALKATKDKRKKNHKNRVFTPTKMKALVKGAKKGDFLSKLLRTGKKRR